MRLKLALFFIFLSLAILVVIFYVGSRFSRTTRPFSEYTILSSSWEKYKEVFINADGRVIDASQNSITTSEGQSYAMLRSVWMDDRQTFDQVWKWTKENLKRDGDNLFGWRWGLRADGSYDFLEEGGENSAADADTDIALALILASRRWSDKGYLDQAKVILDDLWRIETFVAGGKRYVGAGNWANTADGIVINPSYFSPYAWRIFSQVDVKHDWNSLIDPSYELLMKSSQSPLDKSKGVGLPPDWVAIDKNTLELKPTNIENLTSNYSYDAIRVPWRIALDYLWNKEPKALEYLSSLKYLQDYYIEKEKLVDAYSHDGVALSDRESPVAYATSLGYFFIINPQLADEIYKDKVLTIYSNDSNSFNTDLPYYEQNWLWFGAALMNNAMSHYGK